MSSTGLEVFDRSLQITNIWLNEISHKIGPDRQLAWHVLGVVLRALRDRMTVEESAHLAAQLPLIVRGAFYEQYRPAGQPGRIRTRDEFVHKVAENLNHSRPVNPTTAVEAVFETIGNHVDAGAIEKVRHALPSSIRSLWPEHKPTDGNARPA